MRKQHMGQSAIHIRMMPVQPPDLACGIAGKHRVPQAGDDCVPAPALLLNLTAFGRCGGVAPQLDVPQHPAFLIDRDKAVLLP